jgi:hypothetical protein
MKGDDGLHKPSSTLLHNRHMPPQQALHDRTRVVIQWLIVHSACFQRVLMCCYGLLHTCKSHEVLPQLGITWYQVHRVLSRPCSPRQAEKLPLSHAQVLPSLCHPYMQPPSSTDRWLELHSRQHAPQRNIIVLIPGVQV